MVLYAYSYRNYIKEKDSVEKFHKYAKEKRLDMYFKIGNLVLPNINTKK